MTDNNRIHNVMRKGPHGEEMPSPKDIAAKAELLAVWADIRMAAYNLIEENELFFFIVNMRAYAVQTTADDVIVSFVLTGDECEGCSIADMRAELRAITKLRDQIKAELELS